MIKIINGDLIKLSKDGKFDVIAHGCNCFHTMGKGLAKQIKDEFPAAYRADLATVKGDGSKLGKCSSETVIVDGHTITVYNCYTQYSFNKHGERQVRTELGAVRNCMKILANECAGKRIGLPWIGTGLGGADREHILRIIEEELGSLDVTIVEYSK